MRDLNLFESYIGGAKEKRNNKIMVVLGIIYTIIIIVYIILQNKNIRGIEKDIDKLRHVTEDTIRISRMEEIKNKEKYYSELEKNMGNIDKIDKNIADRDVINNKLMDTINTKIPEGIFFTSIDMSSTNIVIKGVSEDAWLVADLREGISKIEGVEDTFVENIEKDDYYYVFNMDIALEGVEEFDDEGSVDDEQDAGESDGDSKETEGS